MKYIHDLNTIQMLGHHFYEQVRPVAGRFLMHAQDNRDR